MRLRGRGVQFWIAVSAVILVSGCASRTAQVAAPEDDSVQSLVRRGDYAAARQILEEEGARSAEQNVLLAESCLGQKDVLAAERAFYAARVQGTLPRDLEYRIRVGLGDLALLKRDAYGAAARFVEARSFAGARAEDDRALVGQARGELLAGNPVGARRLRRQVSMTGVAGLAQLDRDLDASAEKLPVARKKPGSKALVKTRPRTKGPMVHRRSEWRARSIRRSRAESMGRINRLTVHHTAENKKLTLNGVSDSAARMRSYQSSHMNGNHWADIGYHFVIDLEGRIWEGRELRWQGAHAGSNKQRNANLGNVGVALMGNFEKTRPTARQTVSLKKLVEWLVAEYHIRPSRLYTHNEIKQKMRIGGTACPGRHLTWAFKAMREDIRRHHAVGMSDPDDAPMEVAQQPDGDEHVDCPCCAETK